MRSVGTAGVYLVWVLVVSDNAMYFNARMKYFIAIACLFGSGFAALIYEICWIRRATLIFGSTTLAVSTVIAVFFGGLSLGSFIFGRISQRTSRPLWIFALVEVALGGLAVATPSALELTDGLYGSIYRSLSDPTGRTVVRILLIAFVLLPPTTLMGGALPLFCRQFVQPDLFTGKKHGTTRTDSV